MEPPPADFTRAVMFVIREVREGRRITVDELVAGGEFHRSTLHRYLYEERDVPLSALYRMCIALGVEPAEIVERASARLVQQNEISAAADPNPDVKTGRRDAHER